MQIRFVYLLSQAYYFVDIFLLFLYLYLSHLFCYFLFCQFMFSLFNSKQIDSWDPMPTSQCQVSDSQRLRINSSQEGNAFTFFSILQQKLIVDQFRLDPETTEASVRKHPRWLKSNKMNKKHGLSWVTKHLNGRTETATLNSSANKSPVIVPSTNHKLEIHRQLHPQCQELTIRW